MRWQLALDANERALNAASGTLTDWELARWRSEHAEERKQTAIAVARLARTARVRPAPWLPPMAISAQMLGLPETVEACLFDLDGVLTGSGVLHAWAWAGVFDEFLQRVAERNRWHFMPFDREADYLTYSTAVLGSKESTPSYGLARRKGEALSRSLHGRGVTALPGARRYLEATAYAGLRRAIVSASANTLAMLQLAGLSTLVDGLADANLIRAEKLRSRPAPDLLLAACRRLEAEVANVVSFTPTPAESPPAMRPGSQSSAWAMTREASFFAVSEPSGWSPRCARCSTVGCVSAKTDSDRQTHVLLTGGSKAANRSSPSHIAAAALGSRHDPRP